MEGDQLELTDPKHEILSDRPSFIKPEVKAIQILDPGVDHRDSPKDHARHPGGQAGQDL